MFTNIDGIWDIPEKARHKELADKADMPDKADQETYIKAAQKYLDTEAQSRGYDGILSACTYANSTSPRFRDEGKACVEFRDAVWLKCYKLLEDFNAGTIEQPTLKKFLKKLPAITWPI
jgi:hypothetical protein